MCETEWHVEWDIFVVQLEKMQPYKIILRIS